MKNPFAILIKQETLAARWFIAVSIIGIFTLGGSGTFEPVKTVLDSEVLTLKMGNVSISIYKILKGAFVLCILFWVASLAAAFGEKKLKQTKRLRASNKALLIKGLQIAVYFLMLLIGLDVLGIDLTAFAVLGGAIGIGIGFGLQKVTSNFISGLILLFEKSVEESDLIELGDGTIGFIRKIGARYTLLETMENREVMIPNEDFITSRVTNWTFSNTKGRVDVHLGVAYGSNLDKVMEILVETAKEHPRCSDSHEPECFLVEFADSSINFTLYFWVDDIIEGRKRPRSDILLNIWRKFEKNGIEIPFPQQDIHIKSKHGDIS